MKIVIISASVRQGRKTHAVALHLEERIKALPDFSAEMIDLAEIPLNLHQDMYKVATADSMMRELGEKLHTADAFLFVSPEYNGSYTAALKNFVDHFNKPEFSRKPIGVVSISSGAMGGMRGALQMQQLVLALFAYPIPQMLLVPNVQEKFEDDGKLLDAGFDKSLKNYLNEFCWFTQMVSERKAEGLPV